jgi:hypothetical protein
VRRTQQEPSRLRLAVEIQHDAHFCGIARHLVFGGGQGFASPCGSRREELHPDQHHHQGKDAAQPAAKSRRLALPCIRTHMMSRGFHCGGLPVVDRGADTTQFD